MPKLLCALESELERPQDHKKFTDIEPKARKHGGRVRSMCESSSEQQYRAPDKVSLFPCCYRVDLTDTTGAGGQKIEALGRK